MTFSRKSNNTVSTKLNLLDFILAVWYYYAMSYKLLTNENAPDYNALKQWYGYDELKDYFMRLLDHSDIRSATKRFLSNVEGLGDYFDKHALFDFQAYLVLNVVWFERENKALNFLSPEYKKFTENLRAFLNGDYDSWCNKSDLDSMKNDAKKLVRLYY